MATIFKIKITDYGYPYYWYAGKIGQEFECVKHSDCINAGRNGWSNPVYCLKPDMEKIKTGNGWHSKEIRIEDAQIIDTWTDQRIDLLKYGFTTVLE